jgi:hypothetical protein
VNSEIAARLESLRIQWFASEKGYTFFTRDNCAAIGREQANGYSVGSSGMMTEGGFAYLIWRDDRPFFAAHGGNEAPANRDQVDAVRQFSNDLKTALAR